MGVVVKECSCIKPNVFTFDELVNELKNHSDRIGSDIVFDALHKFFGEEESMRE